MKIVKTGDCDGQTKKNFPACQIVKFVVVETDKQEYVGSFVVGLSNGRVCRSNGMDAVRLDDAQIKRALTGHVEKTSSNGWWLN